MMLQAIEGMQSSFKKEAAALSAERSELVEGLEAARTNTGIAGRSSQSKVGCASPDNITITDAACHTGLGELTRR